MIEKTIIQLTREQQAILNNIRAIVNRQLRSTSLVEAEMVAKVLLKYAELMREGGLSAELLEYLEPARDRVDENSIVYLQLTVEMATTMDALDDYYDEAEALYRDALSGYERFDSAEVAVERANAEIAYGRHVLNVSHLQVAVDYYQHAIELLTDSEYPVEAAMAASELGRAYSGQGDFEGAVPYFEQALAVIDKNDDLIQDARTKADFATTLIQIGETDRAKTYLEDALDVCNTQGLWVLRGQVRRQLAYIDQMLAEAVSDNDEKQVYLDDAKKKLNDTIDDLLPIRNTLGLAVAYHDLGRLEAKRREFDDAEAHVRQSIEMFSRVGNRRNYAVALITLAQITLLKHGDSVKSVQYVRQALNTAETIGDDFTLQQAAETLMRIHRIQAKRATDSKAHEVHQHILEQITYSRDKFTHLNLPEHVSLLDGIIQDLEN